MQTGRRPRFHDTLTVSRPLARERTAGLDTADEDPRTVRKDFLYRHGRGRSFLIQSGWHRQLHPPVATPTCDGGLFLYVLMRLHLDDALVTFFPSLFPHACASLEVTLYNGNGIRSIGAVWRRCHMTLQMPRSPGQRASVSPLLPVRHRGHLDLLNLDMTCRQLS